MRRMLCLAIAIGIALCAIPSLGVRAVSVDHCQYARAHDKRVGTEITDPRVTGLLSAVVDASGFRHDVIVCEIFMPRLNATVGRLGKHYYIGLTKSVLKDFTDAELQAVLGHEMAHIVLGHRDPGFELTNRRTPRFEEAADALSAKWFDKAAMQSVLKKLRVDASALPNDAMRSRAVREIDARIKALQ
jgi:Zn-dependent protease with chaperone function